MGSSGDALQQVWTRAELCAAELGHAAHWTTPSQRERVTRALRWPALTTTSTPEPAAEALAALDTLIVVGGGALIDRAKLLRWPRWPRLRLIAVPSLWGSGAESSPVAVADTPAGKAITIDPGLRPEVRVRWPELLEGVPERRLRQGSGDVWAHALEGFLSPLARPELCAELAALMQRMLGVGLGRDPEWLELSAAASAGPACAGVGLVHGIAHVLEGAGATDETGAPLGHAALCSTWLWPVLRFDEQATAKVEQRMLEHAVDLGAVRATARALFDEALCARLLPLLRQHWPAVLRERCTRTNGALVRPSTLDALAEILAAGGRA